MAQILRFPSSAAYAPVRVRSGGQHNVRIVICDARRPEEARWHMQWAIQRAASFRALDGFTNRMARRGLSHHFVIGRTRLLRRFLTDIEELVSSRRVIVEIDGRAVTTMRRRSA